jgi:hypothetical protein
MVEKYRENIHKTCEENLTIIVWVGSDPNLLLSFTFYKPQDGRQVQTLLLLFAFLR